MFMQAPSRTRLRAQTVCVEQEIEETHGEYPVVVHIGLHEALHHNDLAETVIDSTQGLLRLFAFLVGVYRERRVFIVAPERPIGNVVDLDLAILESHNPRYYQT